MKRSLGALGLFFSAAVASGCPVYSDNVVHVECIYANDCPFGYRCSGGICVASPPHGGTPTDGGGREAGSSGPDAGTDAGEAGTDALGRDVLAEGASSDALLDGAADAPSSSDASPAVFCGNPNDCAADETCSTDGVCHRGNCSVVPCINQYQCAITASGPACVRGAVKGCGADRQCFANERCIDGTCTAITELCTDRAQCGAGKACADGRCVTSCTADGQCAAGFLCRTALGICGAKAEPCVHTADCGSKDQVCVDGACVPRCAAVGACGAGAGVCVDNGCVPSARVVSECDGQGTPTGCSPATICLHHHCYASCAQDAGTPACSAQSSAPVCKVVTVGGTGYGICGTTETLGSDCDVTAGKVCTDGKTCVDGYCR